MNRNLSGVIVLLVLISLAREVGAVSYQFTKIAMAGEAAPGTSGAVFSTFGIPLLNNNGTVAFRANTLIGVGDTTSSNDTGVWTDSDLVIREGDLAAGTMGATYSGIEPSINDSGVSAYGGALKLGIGDTEFSNREGVWTNEGLIARAGDVAPDTGGAIRAAAFAVPAISDSGKLVTLQRSEVSLGGSGGN